MRRFSKVLSLVLAMIMAFGMLPFEGIISFAEETAEASENTYKVGDIIEYGYYPQSKVTDAALISNLNNAKGVWQSYNYYENDSNMMNMVDFIPEFSDYMRYKDVVYNGEAYRAVTFDRQRPDDCMGYNQAISNQGLYGYGQEEIYWFKFEPLKWRVLDPDEGLVQSATLIDSQPYNATQALKIDESQIKYENFAYLMRLPHYIDREGTAYSSNYGTSDINKWLNSSFLDTAFSGAQQENLKTVNLVKNSGDPCADYNISVKSFLLSKSEQSSAAYGFGTKDSRTQSCTEYSECQNILAYYSDSCYWTRTDTGSSDTINVYSFSGVCYKETTDLTWVGVAPCVKLSSFEDNCDHNYVLTDVPATCLEEGYQTYKCTKCGGEIGGRIETYDKGEHTIVTIPGVAPTCLDTGLSDSSYCSVCGTVFSKQEVVAATGHIDENGDQVCDVCGYEPDIKMVKNIAVGTDIEFGSYPQSQVTSDALIEELNADEGEWISYDYYAGTGSYNGTMTASDTMKYKDVTLDGVKYRGVIFTAYRPDSTSKAAAAANSNQDDNGYETGTAYWFEYEPIKWRVINPSTGMVVTETILDAQPYSNYIKSSGSNFYGDADCTTYSNNYENSSIRQWLNDDFYNTAFSDEEKALIQDTTIDNSATNYTYDSASTTDKVYLLSRDDVNNSAYGMTEGSDYNSSRISRGTDYAKAQGLSVNTDTGYAYDYQGNSAWILRTAASNSYSVTFANFDGTYSQGVLSCTSSYGIRPVINISPDYSTTMNKDCAHAYTTYTGLADCENGSTITYVCMKCGYSYTEEIPALGHIHVTSEEISATCLTDGKTQGDYCSRCGKVFIAQETVTAPGSHTPADAVKENVTAPTNTTAGSFDEVVYCSACDEELSRVTKTIPVGFLSASCDKTEIVRGETATFTVTTTTDVTWLELVGSYTTASGEEKTLSTYFRYNASGASAGVTVTDADGVRTWVIPVPVSYTASDESINISWNVLFKGKGLSDWYTAATDDGTYTSALTVYRNAALKNPAPSESYDRYTLISVDTDKASASVGDTVTFTVNTTSDVTKVRIGYSYTANDASKTKSVTYQKTSSNVKLLTDNGDGTLTWTISYKIPATAAGTTDFGVQVRGEAWGTAQTKTITTA